MQLNYFTVSHDIIFLFGSSGDVKLFSCGAKVDFSGWVGFFFCLFFVFAFVLDCVDIPCYQKIRLFDEGSPVKTLRGQA